MNEQTIANCPMCGGKAKLNYGCGCRYVSCTECLNDGTIANYEDEAVYLWNEKARIAKAQEKRKKMTPDFLDIWPTGKA